MGVFMDLHSNISNLFKISTAYFPWLSKILYGALPYLKTQEIMHLGLPSNYVASFFYNL
jgi:hypothetical protein